MANVFQPDRAHLTAKGYEAVAHVPVIFDSNGGYLREHNRYLRERAMLKWHPGGGGDVPSDRTLENIADCLVNFVKWCEARGADWRTIGYDRVLGYQDEQMKGKWSRSRGAKLLPSTANQRTDEVTSFLRWAEFRGLRGSFDVQLFVRSVSRTLELAPRLVRPGRAKEDLISPDQAGFVLPEPEEIRAWLAAVRLRRGYAKYLACRFVMDTGVRKKEAEALTVGQWPTAERIERTLQRGLYSVTMRLVVTKGGRPRSIRIPVQLAQDIRIWIDTKRKNYALRFYKANKQQRTDRLFLSDDPDAHGRPISGQTIYRCFSEVEPHPDGWSPHKGRHTYACFWIMYALSVEAAPRGGLTEMPADWIQDRGEFWLKSLQRQFGHVSSDTTEEYLRWLVFACGIAKIASGWHHFLAGESDV